MKYIAAIDQGTTSTRGILFDRTGQPVAQAQQEHRQIYPRPGWMEPDPAEILARTLGVMAEALGFAKCEPGDLAVIVGLTRFVNKGHIARAALEATAYQIREVLEAMNRDSGVPLSSLKGDQRISSLG